MNQVHQQVQKVRVKVKCLQHPQYYEPHISASPGGEGQNNTSATPITHAHQQMQAARVKAKCLQHPQYYEPPTSASSGGEGQSKMSATPKILWTMHISKYIRSLNSLRCEQVHPLLQFSQLRRSTSTAPVHSAVNKYSSCPSSLSCEKVTTVLSAVIRYICCPSSLGCKKVHLLPQFAQLRKSTSAPPVHSAVKKLPQFSQPW